MVCGIWGIFRTSSSLRCNCGAIVGSSANDDVDWRPAVDRLSRVVRRRRTQREGQ